MKLKNNMPNDGKSSDKSTTTNKEKARDLFKNDSKYGESKKPQKIEQIIKFNTAQQNLLEFGSDLSNAQNESDVFNRLSEIISQNQKMIKESGYNLVRLSTDIAIGKAMRRLKDFKIPSSKLKEYLTKNLDRKPTSLRRYENLAVFEDALKFHRLGANKIANLVYNLLCHKRLFKGEYTYDSIVDYLCNIHNINYEETIEIEKCAKKLSALKQKEYISYLMKEYIKTNCDGISENESLEIPNELKLSDARKLLEYLNKNPGASYTNINNVINRLQIIPTKKEKDLAKNYKNKSIMQLLSDLKCLTNYTLESILENNKYSDDEKIEFLSPIKVCLDEFINNLKNE